MLFLSLSSFKLSLLFMEFTCALFYVPQNLSPDKIFHVIVAPCYDKKLEALREDFYTALYNSQEVDCVLTSG